MKLEDAFKIAEKEYEKACKSPYVKFPVAYAMYKAWRWADSKAKKARESGK